MASEDTTEFKRGTFPRGPSPSGISEVCSKRITAGAASSTMRRAASTVQTAATRNPSSLASNSRRAAAHSSASSLTNRMVCSLVCIIYFLAAFFFVARARKGSKGGMPPRTPRILSVSSSTRKGFATWQVIALQKVAGTRGENVSGNKKKALVERILGANQRHIKVFPIEFGHFHIANGESIGDT